MAKTFLRSGNLDAVLALGENGQPVYTSALQIRETLRLRRQPALANCLAIPQPNERGDRLDWYAPFSGKVKSWLAASDHERRQALKQLTSCQQDLVELSTRARNAENPAMRLFGALLAKSLQFPDQQYVYLVDGKPVITFWGFVDAAARTRDDALSCLRDSLEVSMPPLLPEAPAENEMPMLVAQQEPEQPTVAVIPPPQPADEPEIAVPVASRSRWRAWYLLPPVAVAAAIGVTVWLHSPQPSAPTSAAAEPAPAKQPITPPVIKPLPVVVSAQTLATSLPQSSASVMSASPVPDTAPSATLANVVAPAEPGKPAQADDLVMSAEDVRIGSVKFLDGRWRVTLHQTNLPTGKPPSLRYQFKNGVGTALVTQGDGIRCKADITAGMMSSGNLVIRSRYTARCSDGSRYRMPQLICKQGDGAADCQAQYRDDQVFPMTIKRESK